MIRRLGLGLIALCACATAHAHEVRPARLTVIEISDHRYLVQWKVPALGDRVLAIHPVFESNCVVHSPKPSSPSTGEERGGGEPLQPPTTETISAGAFVQTWTLECPEGLAGTTIHFENLPATMIDVLVQVTFLDGRYHTGLVRPDAAVYTIPERASESAVFGDYLFLGVEHILLGWDHLLFVLGLVLLVTSRKRLLWAITGFTLGHSITLGIAALGFVFIDGRPVEAMVALSIVFLAVENARSRRTGVETLAVRSPWLVSSLIGLVHGLGFAGALSEYGLPPYAQYLSLFAFNLGVELGQLAFVSAMIVLGAILSALDSEPADSNAAAKTAQPIPGSAPAHAAHIFPMPVQHAATWLIGVSGSYWLVERTLAFYN